MTFIFGSYTWFTYSDKNPNFVSFYLFSRILNRFIRVFCNSVFLNCISLLASF